RSIFRTVDAMLSVARKRLKKIPGVEDLYLALTLPARRLAFRFRGGTRFGQQIVDPELAKAIDGEDVNKTDISDHLGSILFYALDSRPKLIVELGTRGGESTRSLLAAAHISKATMLSVDIGDCGRVEVPHRERWNFVRSDDVAFGKNGFAGWCTSRGLQP